MARMFAGAAMATVLATTGVAQAQEGEGAGSRVLKSFSDCRAIGDPAQRLACFDKAASALETAVKANDVRIVDRGDVRKARRSLFGFTLPKLNLFGDDDDRDAKEPKFTEINTTVASSRPLGNGRVEITLADEGNPVWQTTEALNWPPKPGAKIRIRAGTMGGYFITVDSRSYRGMRVR